MEKFKADGAAQGIDWTRINNDVNGNPRYVCHFLSLLTQAEKDMVQLPSKYDIALARASRIGGRKFHNKQYGGGIVFQSYSLQETEAAIARAIEYDTIPNECYFIVDDVIQCGYAPREGFCVMYGNPETASGVTQGEFRLLREAKAFIAKHTVQGEKVYRVNLARRHGAHSVQRIAL